MCILPGMITSKAHSGTQLNADPVCEVCRILDIHIHATYNTFFVGSDNKRKQIAEEQVRSSTAENKKRRNEKVTGIMAQTHQAHDFRCRLRLI